MSNVITGTVATKGTIKGNLQAVYGKDGESAYEIALKNGFEGTETEWLDSLKGAKGDTGAQGVQGVQGIQGIPGEQGIQGVQGERGEKGDRGNPGVYLGSGEMPSDCNVQIDPDGEPIGMEGIIAAVLVESQAYIDEQLGVIENGSY